MNFRITIGFLLAALVLGGLVFGRRSVQADVWLPSGDRVRLDEAAIIGTSVQRLTPSPRRRLAGEVVIDLPPELDWPLVADTSEDTWRQAVENIAQSKQQLREAISQRDDQQLSDPVPVKNYSAYVLLHGVIQHNLYHAGQIAVLKKFPSVP